MIVQYYADSLGLPRPGIAGINDRYIFLFGQWLREKYPDRAIHIVDRSRRGATSDVLFEIYAEDEEYFQEQKHILIIHEGICDCAPRPVPKRVRRIVSMMPGIIRKRIIHFLHQKRAWLLQHGSVHLLVEPEPFEQIWTKWLEDASKKFLRIYVLNIAPTNTETETRSPGLQASISKYNEILRRVTEKFDQKTVRLINVHRLVSSAAEIDNLIVKEDGHHITAQMHALLAEALISFEKSEG